MELEELKSIWLQYDKKLNNLEKLNKKILKETLLKKPQQKINKRKYRRLFVMFYIIAIAIFIILLSQPFFIFEKIDWKIITGCILAILCLIYIFIVNLKFYMILKSINLNTDSVIESTKKIVQYKNKWEVYFKSIYMLFPTLCIAGILLIGDSWKFDIYSLIRLIPYIIAFIIVTLIMPKKRRNKIKILEKEILDLKEYID